MTCFSGRPCNVIVKPTAPINVALTFHSQHVSFVNNKENDDDTQSLAAEKNFIFQLKVPTNFISSRVLFVKRNIPLSNRGGWINGLCDKELNLIWR